MLRMTQIIFPTDTTSDLNHGQCVISLLKETLHSFETLRDKHGDHITIMY